MISILPPWLTCQGPARTAEFLADPSLRKWLRGECDRYWRFIHRGEWERAYIKGDRRFPELNGKHFSQIAGMQNKDP